MPIKVNANIPSLQAGRGLQRSAKAISQAFEQLSSGVRINSAADDAAGLAIADRLGAQFRSLNTALRNANDGFSMAQVADSALGQTSDILTRMRELTVQAGNDTLTAGDRRAIQGELDQLGSELDRIGSQTEFNTQKLLNGTFSGSFQVGAQPNETIDVSMGDARPSALGARAQATGAAADASAVAAGELSINGIAIRATTAGDDTLSTAGQASSAIAKANAINDAAGLTGVTATVGAAEATAGGAVGGGDLAAGDLTINGVDIGAVSGVQAGDQGGHLAAAINASSGATGVTANVDDVGQLVLTAADGRNIDVQVGGGAGVHGFAADTLASGAVTLTSFEDFTVAGEAGRIGMAAGETTVDAGEVVSGVSVASDEGRSGALATIDAALNQVAQERGRLGAVQNRFVSTIGTLQAATENLLAAQSRIRDADFAQQTAELTRAQIIEQAGIAIKAQANAAPAVVLSLLS